MARSNTVYFVPIAILTLIMGCGSTQSEEVIVYTSVDDVFARPVAERFEQATGVVVRLVPDTEETKSTGLVNRLIAERGADRGPRNQRLVGGASRNGMSCNAAFTLAGQRSAPLALHSD